VSVLMRYTLRLLTLDQLGRAATMVCALELDCGSKTPSCWDRGRLSWGCGSGRRATPNHMGRKGDNNRNSARARTMDYQNDSAKAVPDSAGELPVVRPPLYQRQLQAAAQRRRADRPAGDVCQPRVRVSRSATAARHSDPDRRRADLPAAARVPDCHGRQVCQPAVGRETPAALFGKVDAPRREGFYGPMRARHGAPLPRAAAAAGSGDPGRAAPDLGPLGTMVGLYERRLMRWRARSLADVRRPKIVASTATVRRAERQIRALFGRTRSRCSRRRALTAATRSLP
jgi:hypothetical protein